MLVLLDTNAYLRLAKRIRPAVGISFGQKGYVLTVHKSVEDEVHRNPRLKAKYPWFDSEEFATERLAKQIRLSEDDKQGIAVAQSILHGWVLSDVDRYTSGGRSPPGQTDCWLLALGQVKSAIVVTDDLGILPILRQAHSANSSSIFMMLADTAFSSSSIACKLRGGSNT